MGGLMDGFLILCSCNAVCGWMSLIPHICEEKHALCISRYGRAGFTSVNKKHLLLACGSFYGTNKWMPNCLISWGTEGEASAFGAAAEVHPGPHLRLNPRTGRKSSSGPSWLHNRTRSPRPPPTASCQRRRGNQSVSVANGVSGSQGFPRRGWSIAGTSRFTWSHPGRT